MAFSCVLHEKRRNTTAAESARRREGSGLLWDEERWLRDEDD